MDRYEAFTDYAAAKHRIFMNQTADDVAVLNADDPIVSSWASGLRAKVTEFSVRRALDNGVFLRGEELIARNAEGEQVVLRAAEMKLRGLHNIENVAAGIAAGIAAGASLASMGETVKQFNPVEHRLEFVAVHDLLQQ
jgi:UDP-N-acetylmuramoylalanine--D-glutamate ligase